MIWVNRILLGLGAVTAIVLALAILFLPGPFYAGYGIDPAGQVSLLNELKAPALVILALGLIQGAGLIRASWQRNGLLAGALLYLGFGLARLLAILLDGLPANGLVWVMAIELLLGLFFALALWRQRPALAG
ncbi:DUF4345 domain-containing protein [Devosia sp. CAU 1758]